MFTLGVILLGLVFIIGGAWYGISYVAPDAQSIGMIALGAGLGGIAGLLISLIPIAVIGVVREMLKFRGSRE
jgi:hypothetical protein